MITLSQINITPKQLAEHRKVNMKLFDVNTGSYLEIGKDWFYGKNEIKVLQNKRYKNISLTDIYKKSSSLYSMCDFLKTPLYGDRYVLVYFIQKENNITLQTGSIYSFNPESNPRFALFYGLTEINLYEQDENDHYEYYDKIYITEGFYVVDLQVKEVELVGKNLYQQSLLIENENLYAVDVLYNYFLETQKKQNSFDECMKLIVKNKPIYTSILHYGVAKKE